MTVIILILNIKQKTRELQSLSRQKRNKKFTPFISSALRLFEVLMTPKVVFYVAIYIFKTVHHVQFLN